MLTRSHPAPFAAALQPVLLALGFFVAYVLLDGISFIHPLQEFNITPWNPQPALAIALITRFGYRWVGWVFLTVLAAEFVVRGLHVPFGDALVLSALLTAGYTGIAWLLQGPFAIALDLARRRDLLNLAASVAIGAGATGIVYVGALCLGGFVSWSEYPHAVLRFWVGDSIGILITLCLLLLVTDAHRRKELAALLRKREVLLQIAVIVALLLVVFALEEADRFKSLYLLFLPLIWVAARHGLAAAIGAVALIQGGVLLIMVTNGNASLSILEMQVLLLALAMTGLLLGVTVDEWRFASERLARSQELTVASELATALAHELNQPLTALSTYSDAIRLLAASPQGDPEALIDVAERIRRVATRSACIIGRLRSLGATCRGRMERVPLEAPLHDALDALAERIARAGAAVEIERLDALPLVRVDRDRITFVFQNLLRNALDAVEQCPPQARRVVVTLRREDATRVAITVRDTGPGIGADMAEKIFETFHSGKATGMGLGLALSRSIVESHGGRLWLEPAGHGVFHIRLPL